MPVSEHVWRERSEALVFAEGVPLRDLAPRVLADLLPVGAAGGAGAVCAEHQASQNLVFSGAVKVHDQELNGDVWQ